MPAGHADNMMPRRHLHIMLVEHCWAERDGGNRIHRHCQRMTLHCTLLRQEGETMDKQASWITVGVYEGCRYRWEEVPDVMKGCLSVE